MLVGGIPTPLKNDGVRQSQLTEWKVIKFHGSKPPSSMALNFSLKPIGEIPSV
jgi:hypothetical protein